jgi:hypothetical protein
MKNKRIIYWLLTGAMSFFMLFAAWYAETHEIEFTQRLGFPEYFRIELSVAKIIGAIVLLIPQIPQRVREWVYLGFSICLISAFIAKCYSGYTIPEIAQPGFAFISFLLLIYGLNKVNRKG